MLCYEYEKGQLNRICEMFKENLNVKKERYSNTVFIYGDEGSGKSHMVDVVVKGTHKLEIVTYIKGETLEDVLKRAPEKEFVLLCDGLKKYDKENYKIYKKVLGDVRNIGRILSITLERHYVGIPGAGAIDFSNYYLVIEMHKSTLTDRVEFLKRYISIVKRREYNDLFKIAALAEGRTCGDMISCLKRINERAEFYNRPAILEDYIWGFTGNKHEFEMYKNSLYDQELMATKKAGKVFMMKNRNISFEYECMYNDKSIFYDSRFEKRDSLWEFQNMIMVELSESLAVNLIYGDKIRNFDRQYETKILSEINNGLYGLEIELKSDEEKSLFAKNELVSLQKRAKRVLEGHEEEIKKYKSVFITDIVIFENR